MAFRRASCNSQKRMHSALEVLKSCFLFFTSVVEGNTVLHTKRLSQSTRFQTLASPVSVSRQFTAHPESESKGFT